MGLLMQRNENRSELQDKIAAELQEKARAREMAKNKRPDGVDDAKFLHDTKQTTSLAPLWIALIVIAVAIAVFIIVNPV